MIGALIILAVSKLITILTGLSLSAIATNTQVKGGGAYYLISRSLGVEFGGAIGLVFFLAQAISVSLYVLGFAEAFIGSFNGIGPDSMLMVATITNIIVFACVYIGAGWTIKLQYFILGVLLLSLISFGIGAANTFDPSLLQANMESSYTVNEKGIKESMFLMFALFFPAVTGIMRVRTCPATSKTLRDRFPTGPWPQFLPSPRSFTAEWRFCWAGVRHEKT